MSGLVVGLESHNNGGAGNPSHSQGYLRVASNGATHSGAYNVATVTDTNVGRRTVVWDVDFSDTTYTFLVTDGAQATNSIFRTGGPTAAGSVPFSCQNYDFSGYVDGDTGNAAFGMSTNKGNGYS